MVVSAEGIVRALFGARSTVGMWLIIAWSRVRVPPGPRRSLRSLTEFRRCRNSRAAWRGGQWDWSIQHFIQHRCWFLTPGRRILVGGTRQGFRGFFGFVSWCCRWQGLRQAAKYWKAVEYVGGVSINSEPLHGVLLRGGRFWLLGGSGSSGLWSWWRSGLGGRSFLREF